MNPTIPTKGTNTKRTIVSPKTHCKTNIVNETTIDCIAWNLTNLSFSRMRKITPVIGPKT